MSEGHAMRAFAQTWVGWVPLPPPMNAPWNEKAAEGPSEALEP